MGCKWRGHFISKGSSVSQCLPLKDVDLLQKEYTHRSIQPDKWNRQCKLIEKGRKSDRAKILSLDSGFVVLP